MKKLLTVVLGMIMLSGCAAQPCFTKECREVKQAWNDSVFANMSAKQLDEANRMLCRRVIDEWTEIAEMAKGGMRDIALGQIEFNRNRCREYL